MADNTRNAKPAISYSDMHNLCNVHVGKKGKYIPRAKSKYYEAERVIERRGKRGKKEYLVKWMGCPTWQSTWEPEENLNATLLRSYHYPPISDNQIDECCLALHAAILQGLKSSGIDAHVYAPFRLDMWRYLAGDKGRESRGGSYLLERDDFDRFSSLPNHWYYTLNQHGEGKAVDFPIKVRPLLGKSGAKNFIVDRNGVLCKAPITYIEKLSIYFVKRACNAQNI